MITRRSLLSLGAVGTAGILTACSSDKPSDSSATGGPETASGAADSTSASQGASSGAPAFPVTVTHGKGEMTFQSAPSKVVVLDITTMDTLVALGVADHVVGIVRNGETLPTDLGDHYSKATVVGNLQEPDQEKIASLDPDLVIVGGRAAKTYDSVAAAFEGKTILIPGDRSTSFEERLTTTTDLMSKIFGAADAAAKALETYNKDVERVKAKGTTVGKGLVLMTSGGKVTAFGKGSRFGIIHDQLGIAPAIEDVEAATHGESISFELISQSNPDWLFVVDRAAAIRSMEAAAAAGVTRYVMVSFLAAYGEVPDDHPLRAYTIAKIAADRHLQTTDLAWTILGPGLLTLDEPTGAITVARVPKGTPTSKAPTSRGNVARVITAVLAEPASIGKVIPFYDGDTPIAQAVADVPQEYADLS